jgi:CHAD domain-containing protein
MTASRRRSELLRSHLNVFTRLLHKVEGGDVRAIHRTRVALQRLRELLPVLELDPTTCTRLIRDLRRATRSLGRVRELDVTLHLVSHLNEEPGELDAGLTMVAEHLRHARRLVHARETQKGRLSNDLRRLGKRLERSFTTLDRRGGERRRWRWVLEARIVRRAEAFEDAVREVGPFYLPEKIHEVRIALKRLRYAVELEAEASQSSPPELRVFRRAQALLGELHDRQRLVDRLRESQAAVAGADRRVSRQLDHLIARVEDECRVLHARYVRQCQPLLDASARLVPAAPVKPVNPEESVARLVSVG